MRSSRSTTFDANVAGLIHDFAQFVEMLTKVLLRPVAKLFYLFLVLYYGARWLRHVGWSLGEGGTGLG